MSTPKDLPQIPSSEDKVDFSQFIRIPPASSQEPVMYTLPHSYFHLWRSQGIEEFKAEIRRKLRDIRYSNEYDDEGRLRTIYKLFG